MHAGEFTATAPVRWSIKICIPERWIHIDIAELIGRDRAEVQPPCPVTATVCTHQVVIDARLAMTARPSSPPLQARVVPRDVHSDSNRSFVRITRPLRGHLS